MGIGWPVSSDKWKAPLDCKTVRFSAYSSTREQSNKRSGARLKTESETEVLTLLLRYTKQTVLQSTLNGGEYLYDGHLTGGAGAKIFVFTLI